jgi:nucleotide-sensitive chloride channel 1A
LLTPEPLAESSPTEAAEKLFTAVSDCADLHPDPDEDDDQEQEQEPEPGTGGWITSENLQDFMDENGEFRMPENGSLGAGAGTVRNADQFDDAVDGDDVNGEDTSDDTKWRRTS